MSITREFTVHLEDRPGTLGTFCRALAEQGVNITAFQATSSRGMSLVFGGKSLVRLVVDNPAIAKTLLDKQGVKYTEAMVAQVKLPHRPGELARVASTLGNVKINIDYAYLGIDLEGNAPLLIFGTKSAIQASSILEEAATAA